MKDYYPGNLGGNDKRFSRPVRPYDTNQYDRRSGTYNRKNGMQRRRGTPEGDAVALKESLQVTNDYLKKISEVQHRTADAQERVAKAEERKADAMEQITTYLKHMFGKDLTETIEHITSLESSPPSEDPAVQNTPPAVLENAALEETPTAVLENAAIEETPPAHMDAGDAVTIITLQRQDGVSFDKIANHLNAEGIPSVSGNGKWNRKTVSKFYKESVQ